MSMTESVTTGRFVALSIPILKPLSFEKAVGVLGRPGASGAIVGLVNTDAV